MKLLATSLSAAFFLCSASGIEVASAQPPADERLGEDEAIAAIDEQFELDVETVALAQPNESLPDFVSVVRSSEGVLSLGYYEQTRCESGYCLVVVYDAETDEPVFLDGHWAGGFLATGNGEEVIHIRPEPDEQQD